MRSTFLTQGIESIVKERRLIFFNKNPLQFCITPARKILIYIMTKTLK